MKIPQRALNPQVGDVFRHNGAEGRITHVEADKVRWRLQQQDGTITERDESLELYQTLVERSLKLGATFEPATSHTPTDPRS